MQCPACNTELKMSERQGIEIDYCPQCRGVWLDRGELDKIIERAAPASFENHRDEDDRYRHNDERRDDHDRYGHKKRRRGSFLENLFD